jgi:hypothetical protein
MIKIKGMIVLIIFILSTITSFSGMVSAESFDDLTPEQKVIEHIKGVSNCNDLEASMIFAIMANRSVNYEGLDFYVRYLEEDPEAKEMFKSSVRYHDYYVFWEGFLKDWSTKTLQEKAEALNIDTATVDTTNKILDEAKGQECVFIMEYITPTIEKIAAKAQELKDSAGELEIEKIKRLSGELKDLDHEYLDKIQEAHITYQLSGGQPDDETGMIDYKNDADKIFYNDSLTTKEKVIGLESLKADYAHMQQEINNKYNVVDGLRKDVNTHGQAILGAGIALTSIGIGLIAGGFGPLGVAGFVIGGIVAAMGVTCIGIGGTMCDSAHTFTKATQYMLEYQNKFDESYQQAVAYIDGLIKLL